MKVRMGLAPLQFSDGDEQTTSDLEKLFKLAVERRWAWFFGTEAGPGAGNTGKELLRLAKEHNYKPWVPSHQADGIAQSTDCWIMVRKDLISGGWKRGYKHVFNGSAQTPDHVVPDGQFWGPKGLVHASFDCDKLDARINLAAGHYLTGARDPSSPLWKLNRDLGLTIGNWMKDASSGTALSWYGGDQNMDDSQNNQPQGDTFFGAPITTAGDELEVWRNTGHGKIDVIATPDKDGRVSARSSQIFTDRGFPLHQDHAVTEATYNVDPRKN